MAGKIEELLESINDLADRLDEAESDQDKAALKAELHQVWQRLSMVPEAEMPPGARSQWLQYIERLK